MNLTDIWVIVGKSWVIIGLHRFINCWVNEKLGYWKNWLLRITLHKKRYKNLFAMLLAILVRTGLHDKFRTLIIRFPKNHACLSRLSLASFIICTPSGRTYPEILRCPGPPMLHTDGHTHTHTRHKGFLTQPLSLRSDIHICTHNKGFLTQRFAVRSHTYTIGVF